ncbi:hypothetical protein COB55_03585 [Candidatus Wolfebacteria bacterium]|nr:MAG: hypothetical protein COB55_03585 [Candidatus Wolfebacteria bacterium]
MEKNKIIGISIDGIIRDNITQIAKIYREETGNKPNLPLKDYNLIEMFPFDSMDQLNEFLYITCPLETAGHAKEINLSSMNDVNILCDKSRKQNCKIKIISKELGKSKSATLFFLSKIVCQVDEIIFVTSEEDKWNHCDILLDVNPLTLKSKPDGKTSIKLETEYNEDITSDYTIKSVKELLDEKFLEEVINHEFVSYEEIK